MSKPLIVIPARMASKRFPGKPLAEIAGISMLRRTANVAANVAGSEFVVATDHAEIAQHCDEHSLPVVMTAPDLPSGSDRALAASQAFRPEADIIINLQGDAPFSDPAHIAAVIDRLKDDALDIATPAIELSWAELDVLRATKVSTPFSGTTVVEKDGRAFWFSKTIIPAMRKEAELRGATSVSPILRHVGLYGFKRAALERFNALPESHYETLEGLEQLRAIEAGMHVAIVRVSTPQISSPGIDTPEDLARAEALIQKLGDPFLS
ncbi:3-deoxy-manno-octulosonate cytidylyltransferase [Litorimonas cladophorae]|uniref:3-deoxy-manno-octulosonate cytidylyltransferase n=1 Tax=Litorimonas cladophorae TaxID=1220491 RepID=A0A918ND96_9PROT|nr:manno-octulosonate cytidylyltransferase [Litorimonas cladophorae]GGX59027.1 3-deoxy-manno-octulosonate cytidylyltransferase [Litorimonas cladophorae]